MLNIYLIEDSNDIRNGLLQAFEQSATVNCVGFSDNAEKGIEEIQKINPDILILDIHLPGMHGHEAVKAIREKNIQIPVMMFTVFDDDQHLFESLKNGANAYMLKHTPTPKLIDALHELNEGGAPMSPRIAKKVLDSFSFQQVNSKLVEELSQIEKNIIDKLAEGLLYKEISEDLNFTLGTVKQYIHNIYKKLEVNNRTEAINKAFGK